MQGNCGILLSLIALLYSSIVVAHLPCRPILLSMQNAFPPLSVIMHSPPSHSVELVQDIPPSLYLITQYHACPKPTFVQEPPACSHLVIVCLDCQ